MSLRLRLALGLQEARRGRYSASSEQFRAVLGERPEELTALVGLAKKVTRPRHVRHAHRAAGAGAESES